MRYGEWRSNQQSLSGIVCLLPILRVRGQDDIGGSRLSLFVLWVFRYVMTHDYPAYTSAAMMSICVDCTICSVLRIEVVVKDTLQKPE